MNQPQIRCGDRARTTAAAMGRAQRIAAGLSGLGVEPGDRVAVIMRNEIEFIEVSIAAALLGAVPVPVNWHWKGAELAYLLTDSNARAAFVHSDLIPVVNAALDAPPPIVEVVPSDALRAAYRMPDNFPAHDGPELESWLAAQSEPLQNPPTAPLSVIYTSGTTGQPKGILREPMTAGNSAMVGARLFRAFGLSPNMRTMIPAPMYHSAPNGHSLFAAAAGLDVTIMPKFDPKEFLATIERHRIEHTQVVPTMFVRLLQLSDADRGAFDISSLKSVVHAAAPCAPDVKHRMIEWWGPIIHEYYGASETGAVVTCDSAEWLAHPGTVGKALDGAKVRIVLEDGTEAPTGTDGEIYVYPGDNWPNFTYIGNDAKRQGMEREGFLTVGDCGRLDEDGFLYLGDRIADMVISGGVNIYPAEIEACLIGLPGVRDAAVFGIPHDEFGEVLVAHVDTDPASGLTEDDITAHVRTNMANYKVPRTVVIDRELPREDSGKLFKRRIRERYLTAQPR